MTAVKPQHCSECVRETRELISVFSMVMVKLQTKLLFSVPDDTKIPSKNQARTFSWTTTSPSVDHWVQQMLAAGWVDTTVTTKKICSSCRDDKTRQGFARRQWRYSSPKCIAALSTELTKIVATPRDDWKSPSPISCRLQQDRRRLWKGPKS